MIPIVGYDIETTGLLDVNHRVIEIYAGVWDLTTGDLVDEFEQRVNPERSIMAEAQRVHGISGAELVGKPRFHDIALPLKRFLERGLFVVAHNGDEFDMPFTNMELQRVGQAKLTVASFDTMKQGRWATPNGKLPTLGELCFACGVDYDPAKAHAAAYDVDRMMQCFKWGLRWGWFTHHSLYRSRSCAA